MGRKILDDAHLDTEVVLLEFEKIDAVNKRHLEHEALPTSLWILDALVLGHSGATTARHLIRGAYTITESAVDLREVPVVFPELLKHPFLIEDMLDLLLLFDQLLRDDLQGKNFSSGSMGRLHDFALMAFTNQPRDLKVSESLLLL